MPMFFACQHGVFIWNSFESTTHRPFLCFVVITTYNHLPIYFTIIYISKHSRSATVLWILAPYITPVQFTTPPTTLCIYNIETKTPIQFPHLYSQYVFIKTHSTNFPSWRRYTFLSHLATKLKFLLDG